MQSISEKHGIEIINENDLRILSIGISTAGKAEIEMAKRNPKCHIIATTIDEKGIENTKKIISKLNFNNQIELKLEDISKKLEYENNYFDYVYARLVLHYLDNNKLTNALTEINRILKPNGKLYVVVRSENAWEAKLEGSSYNEKTGLTKHPDLRTYGTDSVKYCYRRLHSEKSIREFLNNTGFKIQHVKVYEEFLSIDYERKEINNKASELIEVFAIKS